MWWTEGGGGDGMVYPKLNLHNNDNDNSFLFSLCSTSTSTCCRFVFEFLNRDVVSYMAVGIDLNYFFSWPLVLFIFATRLQGLKTQRHPTWFFTKRGLR